ncbi:MAG TPA: hypothetical protein VKA66_04220, partial [Mycobacterium sp.]|nr:hypothetical protein [Mycobacterium sp.]
MDEHIGSAAIGRDKAKALLAVEPFDDSLCHISRFLIVPTSREPSAGKRSLQVPNSCATKWSVGFISLSVPATERGYSCGRLLLGGTRLAAYRL